MRRLLLLTSLSLVLALVLAPMALAQDPTASATPTATAGGCTTTTDPETGESVTTCIDTAPPTATPTATVTPTPTATVAGKAQYGGDKKVVVLPETGGGSGLAILAGVLLIGSGVMGLALFRRS